jgi:hypothetical protein
MGMHLGWAGSDLKPLPHESNCSTLMRFAWRNTIDEKVQLEVINVRRIYRTQQFSTPDWIPEENILSSQLAWNFPSREEHQALGAFRGLEDILLSRSFRLCPMCIQAAFHSYWHQFVLLDRCPIHLVKLTDKCTHCGLPLPLYSFNKDLLARPYICASCGQSMAGIRPSLERHLGLRKKRRLIESKLGRLGEWLSTSSSVLSFFKELRLAQGGSLNGLNAWCGADRLLREVITRASYDSKCGLIKPKEQITLLSWKVRMVTTGRVISWGSGAKSMRERMILKVYRSTVNMLTNWIVSGLEAERRGENLVVKVRRGIMRIKDVSPELVALHLMRIALESYEPMPLVPQWSVSGLRYDLVSPDYGHERRHPRLAWRAAFLALFASMYCIAKDAKKKGTTINLRAIRTRIDATVAQVLEVEGENTLLGRVVFPSVPDMPVLPFKNTQLGRDIGF